MHFNWVEPTSLSKNFGCDLCCQPAGPMLLLLGLAMRSWLVPYCLRIFECNIWSSFELFLTFFFWSILLNEVLPRIPTRVVDSVGAYRQFSEEFENHGSSTCVFKRTWKPTEFVRLAVAKNEWYYGDPSSELVILGKIHCAIGSGASIISLSGGSQTLVDCYK